MRAERLFSILGLVDPELVEEAMARRPAQLGNTNESLARYRDEMLLEILKLHHKL